MDDAPSLHLKARRLPFKNAEGLANSTYFAAWPRCNDLAYSGATNDQRTGKDKRLVVAAWTGRVSKPGITTGDLADRHRFPSQQRLIGLEIMALNQHCIRRYPVPLRKHNKVAPDHLTTGDSLALPVADYECPRARKIT